jgi:hypothetical protein
MSDPMNERLFQMDEAKPCTSLTYKGIFVCFFFSMAVDSMSGEYKE